MELINLMNHSCAIVDDSGTLIKEYPSRGVATCNSELKDVMEVDGITIRGRRYKPVLGLPTPSVDGDKIYIVDEEVAIAVRDTRMDIVTPMDPVGSEHPYTYRTLMAV